MLEVTCNRFHNTFSSQKVLGLRHFLVAGDASPLFTDHNRVSRLTTEEPYCKGTNIFTQSPVSQEIRDVLRSIVADASPVIGVAKKSVQTAGCETLNHSAVAIDVLPSAALLFPRVSTPSQHHRKNRPHRDNRSSSPSQA